MLLHYDAGGPIEAAEAVVARFGDEFASLRTTPDDLRGNFVDVAAQGPQDEAADRLRDRSG